MSDTTYDLLGIGNAIVDVLTKTDDEFLTRNEISKGTMSLIDEGRAADLYARMGPAVECSGGSASNTVAGLAGLGGKAAFIGKVRNDQLGDVFAHDIRSIGVNFETPRATEGPETARCFVMVTPDAQRSMNTFLGACVGLGPDDIDPALVEASGITYLEGYLWDPPAAKEAFRKAMKLAHDAGREVSLTLSDPFCVDRHRDEFREFVEEHVDILFANEEEAKSLYQVDTFEAAAAALAGKCRVVAITRSEKGAVILSGEDRHEVPAAPVEHVVDTTGAGDLYAAGFLYGLTRGRPLPDCAKMGAVCAAEIISHVGARPEQDLRQLLTGAGLL